MNTLRSLLLIILTVLNLCPALPLMAQNNYPQPTPYEQLTPEERALRQEQSEKAAAAACSVCGGSILVMIGFVVAFIALSIALLVWVARDAKNRGMDSPVLWVILVAFTSVIGLLIYIFSRPQGELVSCTHCRGKRMRVSAKCPHCHNA